MLCDIYKRTDSDFKKKKNNGKRIPFTQTYKEKQNKREMAKKKKKKHLISKR